MDKAKHIIETELKPEGIQTEDGGQAKIFTCSDDINEIGDIGIFVRLQSWDENKIHEEFNKFIGKKIKITIEEI